MACLRGVTFYDLDYLQVVDAAVKQLRSGTLSSTDVARGRAQLKAAILYNQESNSTLAEEIGTQAVLLGSVLSGPAIVSAVNSVTDAEVNAVSFIFFFCFKLSVAVT